MCSSAFLWRAQRRRQDDDSGILLGLVLPDASRVLVLGLDPLVDGARVRSQLGVLLEHDGIYRRLSVEANPFLHVRLQHLPAAEQRPRTETLLRRFDLWGRRRDRGSPTALDEGSAAGQSHSIRDNISVIVSSVRRSVSRSPRRSQ
jgi:ABC-type Na+ transport system ATPase subunit NatA